MKTGTVLFEKTMADGRTLRVLRYVSPEDEVPERVARIEASISQTPSWTSTGCGSSRLNRQGERKRNDHE